MSIAKGLKQLGFENLVDFSLVENVDGIVEIEGWYSESPQPSDEAIEAASAEWQAEHNATQYKRDRAPEYPPIGDQLDALLKHLNYRRTQGDELVQELDDVIAEWLSVKSRHPKP